MDDESDGLSIFDVPDDDPPPQRPGMPPAATGTLPPTGYPSSPGYAPPPQQYAPPQQFAQAPAPAPPAAAPTTYPNVAQPVRSAQSSGPFDFQVLSRRKRPTTNGLEWVSLLFAVIVPPIGLVLSLVSRSMSRRRRRWTTRVPKVALALSVVLTLILGAGSLVYFEFARLAAVRADLVARTAPLCNLEEQHPGTLEDPTFAWPPVAATIPDSIKAIQIYHTQWAYLARRLPDAAKPDAAAVADAALTILTEVETNRVIDGPSNIERMTQVVSSSTLPEWAAEYCD